MRPDGGEGVDAACRAPEEIVKIGLMVMRKAGRIVGKSAFAELVETATDWPDVGLFSNADFADISAPKKGAPVLISYARAQRRAMGWRSGAAWRPRAPF